LIKSHAKASEIHIEKEANKKYYGRVDNVLSLTFFDYGELNILRVLENVFNIPLCYNPSVNWEFMKAIKFIEKDGNFYNELEN
jgi:hypothetical protein